MKAYSKTKAWELVDEIFPTDYNKDEKSSLRSGYDVYRSPINPLDYICDLGNRLEVNFASGKTVNIWIEEEKDFTEAEKVELRHYIDNFLYKLEDNFGLAHEPQMKKYGLDDVMDKLVLIYRELI